MQNMENDFGLKAEEVRMSRTVPRLGTKKSLQQKPSKEPMVVVVSGIPNSLDPPYDRSKSAQTKKLYSNNTKRLTNSNSQRMGQLSSIPPGLNRNLEIKKPVKLSVANQSISKSVAQLHVNKHTNNMITMQSMSKSINSQKVLVGLSKQMKRISVSPEKLMIEGTSHEKLLINQ